MPLPPAPPSNIPSSSTTTTTTKFVPTVSPTRLLGAHFQPILPRPMPQTTVSIAPAPGPAPAESSTISTSVLGGDHQQPGMDGDEAIRPSLESASSSSNGDASKAGPQRSTAGCLTCRRRKVKCDERRPVCAKCTIKQRPCMWPDPDAPVSKRTKKRSSSITIDDFFPPPPPKRHAITQPTTHRPPSHPPPAYTGTPSISPDVVNPFAIVEHSPLQNLDLWPNPFDTPASDPPNDAATTTSLPFLHPLPSLDDIASWTFPPQPPPGRLYVPPDFLPKSLTLEPAKQKLSLLPPKQKARMMADPGFLQPYFPTIDERLVMRHYLLHTVHIIMAFECERTPWNPWVKIHAPLAFAHLPGVAPACDALRAAILAVGAVHLRHIHFPKDKKAASKIARVSIAKVLDLVRQVIDRQTPTNPLETQDIEFIMAALLSCTMASSLAADGAWDELLTSVVDFIERLGGAPNILKDSPRTKMSPLRFCCEQLAIRDVFGCFSTGLPPRILDTAFKPWFFEAESWSHNDDEWESVERMFGISRGMVDVMARACALIHKVQKTGGTLPEDFNGIRSWAVRDELSLRLPERAVARLSTTGPLDTTSKTTLDEPGIIPALDREKLSEETGSLIAELTVWDQASNFTPVHPRTQYANHAYRHTIRIRILREVFGVSMRDARVQTSVKAIIELCTEVAAKFGKVTWFTWPIVIAGFHLYANDPLRKVVSTLLTEFRRYACFDAGAALELLRDVWRQDDAHQSGTIPSQAVSKLSSKPFLD